MSDEVRCEQVPSEPFADTKRLCRELVESTGVDGAGVALFASKLSRDLIFVTDAVAEDLDEIQFTLGEGPCLDAFVSHRPEFHDDIAGGEAAGRWPMFSAQATAVGAASVYAYPLDVGGAPFGVLELYGRVPVALARGEDSLCRLYTGSIGRAVLAELDPVHALTSRPDGTVFRRGNVQVAAGILAMQWGIGVEEALIRLRAEAFSRQRRITDLARDIVAGEHFEVNAGWRLE